jgi:Serine dehydrogenase proteinase
MARSVYDEVDAERFQTGATRRSYYRRMSKIFDGRAVVSLFTSFVYDVQMEHDDCDSLLNVLHQTDLRKGLVLLINSPGGDILAAERIVNICRSYSGTGDYWALVPGRAKSAATIVCLGASKIIMAPSSELGPVDPQVTLRESGVRKHFSVVGLVRGYRDLFDKAVATSGRLEPYIQQLAWYDDREMIKYESWIALSESVTIKILGSGMMIQHASNEIKKKVAMFLEPEAGTQDHGRAISASEAERCGLNVQQIDLKSPDWKTIYDLYYRADCYVSTRVAKLFESEVETFYESRPSGDDE